MSKYKQLILLGLVTAIMIVISISYAWLSNTIFGKKEYVLKVGELDLILDESSNGLLIENEMAVPDDVGLAGEAATFTIKNNSSVDVCYQIYLDDSDLLEGEIRVEDKFIKYSLDKDNIVGNAKVLSSGRMIDESQIRAGSSIHYYLRLWFNSEVNGDYAGQIFKGKIRIEAIQCQNNLPIMRSYTINSTEDYHAEEYRHRITSIVTKNNTMIPDSAIEHWDVSERMDNSVVSYIEDDLNGGYVVTIGGDGKVFANIDSSCLFYDFINVTNLELSFLDTSMATNFDYMFAGCEKVVHINLNHFYTLKVTSMAGMFDNCYYLQTLDLSNFDTSNVTNMTCMFLDCFSLSSLNISSFNTSKVVDMSGMFGSCKVLSELDLRHFDTSKVVNMENMFNNCRELTTLDLTSFHTFNVTNMKNLFLNCRGLLSILVSSHWDSANADVTDMFLNCGVNDLTII